MKDSEDVHRVRQEILRTEPAEIPLVVADSTNAPTDPRATNDARESRDDMDLDLPAFYTASIPGKQLVGYLRDPRLNKNLLAAQPQGNKRPSKAHVMLHANDGTSSSGGDNTSNEGKNKFNGYCAE